jgi:hypothetical protein
MKKAALLVGFLVVSLAQAAPNFSGEWKLNVAKSDYGPLPAPEMLVRTIKHADPSLQIDTHQKGAQGETTTHLTYTTDGKPVVNKLPTGEAKGSAKWDGSHLVIESSREVQGAEIKQKETWTLSDDGKVLTIVNHLTAPQGEFDVKLVLDKQ